MGFAAATCGGGLVSGKAELEVSIEESSLSESCKPAMVEVGVWDVVVVVVAAVVLEAGVGWVG